MGDLPVGVPVAMMVMMRMTGAGGFCINPTRRGLLIEMLLYMQNADSLWSLDYQLQATQGTKLFPIPVPLI